MARSTGAVAKRGLGVGLVLVLLCGLVGAASAAPGVFDHLETGFVLEGPHSYLACESCHVGGQFKGLPRHCSGCHERGTLVSASAKPLNHIVSSPDCAACHAGDQWDSRVLVDHAEVSGSCASCHNGTTALGKPVNHIPSGETCDDCHTTTAWTPAVFDCSTTAG